jgi:hypothetical protein
MQGVDLIQSAPRGDAQEKWWQVTYEFPYLATLTFCTHTFQTLLTHAASFNLLLQVIAQIVH